MEVHHHPQIEKKGFKEYFLEFLMIFLAVTLGFFAESLRESISDRHREKEFMFSMIQDLKSDTIVMNETIEVYTLICKNTDSMFMCLKSGEPDPATISRLVSHSFWRYSGFAYNNRTIEELKNAGNFRLITSKAVADSILKYDGLMNSYVLNQYNDLKYTMLSFKDAEAKVVPYHEFDISFFNSKKTLFDSLDFSATNHHTLITQDKSSIAYFYNRLLIHEALCITFISTVHDMRDWAARLILFIKKEYQVTGE